MPAYTTSSFLGRNQREINQVEESGSAEAAEEKR
jgi:hypothetical protein